MPQSESESIQAYLQVLQDFIAYARDEVEARKQDQQDLSSLSERRERLLTDLDERREATLLAGARVGWPPEKMSALLDDSRRICIVHRWWMEEELGLAPGAGVSTEDALEMTYTRLIACLVLHLRDLEDLVALARQEEESIPTPRGNGPHAPNQFWWRDRNVRLQPLPWKLLEYLWSKETSATVEVDEVADAVWGYSCTAAAIKIALGKVNAALANLQVPFSFCITAGHITRS